MRGTIATLGLLQALKGHDSDRSAFMKPVLISLLALLAVAGCSSKEDSSASLSAQSAKAPDRSAARYLAYQHSIQIDTEENKVLAVFEAAQAACREATADLCEVLESRVSTGRNAAASLRFRAKPSGIPKLIAALSKQGEVVEQSTSAEDLALPIADAAKKLEMLKDYRSKLEALRERAKTNVDALIKVNKELAQVQSDLEGISGQRAHLMQRVETEILNVSIRSIQHRSFWHPIALAMRDFGGNLSQGVSTAIVGVAYLIPWAALLLLAACGGRILWRFLTRRKPSA